MAGLRFGWVVLFVALAAGGAEAAKFSNGVKLNTNGLTIKGTPNPVAHTYTFTVRSFKITDTRSLHEDTDTVFAAAAVANGADNVANPMEMGDLNNGTYTVNLSVQVSLGDDQAVDFTYQIVNGGYEQSYVGGVEELAKMGADKALALGGDAIGQEVGGTLGGAIGLFIGANAPAWAIDKVLGFIFPSCDGVVAAADHMYSGAQLAAQTANGHKIQGTDNNPGTDSPSGCGANSHYYVSWSISG